MVGGARRTGSGSRRRGRGREERHLVEGHLERYSETRAQWAVRWFVLQMNGDGSPSLHYRAAAGAPPQSILRGRRATSPERGTIALEEIRAVQRASLGLRGAAPDREFQLALGGGLMLLRAPDVASCKMWLSALEIARSSSWRRHQSEAALPAGWKSSVDRQGRTFYYNKRLGERSWYHPATGLPGPVDAPAEPEPERAAPLPGLLRLRVEAEGFFGVMLEEEIDGQSRCAYVRVKSVAPESLAGRQLAPRGLAAGWLVHSAQGRAVGYLGTAAVVELLKQRPLSIVFAHQKREVDVAAEEEVQVRSFLETLGQPEHSSAVVAALRRDGHHSKRQYVAALQDMQAEGSLEGFLATCAAHASQEDAAASAEEGTPPADLGWGQVDWGDGVTAPAAGDGGADDADEDLDFGDLEAAEEEEELHGLWYQLDRDGSGELDRGEVQQLLLGMGRPAADSDMDAAMAELDKDGNGTVEWEEFLEWWHSQDPRVKKQLVADAMEMQDRWYQLDTDNSGARALLSTSAAHVLARAERFSVVTLHCMGWAGGLDRSEVQQLLKGMGKPAEESDMDAAMAELDKDGNGTVEFTEFLDWWQGGKLSKEDKRLIAGALGVSEPEPEPEPQPKVRPGVPSPRPGRVW